MKKIIFVCVAALCLASCQQIDLNGESGESARNVQFVMKGLDVDYSVTRATLASENMTDLWVYEGTTLLKHQTSTDADFGAPTVSLTIGAHNLTFVASKATGQAFKTTEALADNHWTCTKVSDTYGCTLSYTVSASSTSKQVQLTRVNGKVMWTIEDAVPTDVSSVSFSIPQCYGLDADLNGVDAGLYEVTSTAIASKVGTTGYAPYIMVLPVSHTDGVTISPTITFSNGVTYTTECTVDANVVTNIHGSFFSGQGGLTMVLNSDWNTQNDVSIR